jgi:DNA polymerase-3 subunit delta'
MVFGYDDLVADFKRLIDERALSHAYLFFGEPQTGKFLFAQCLAHYAEHGVFETPSTVLREALIINRSVRREERDVDATEAGGYQQNGAEGTIGISQVRDVTRFLHLKPVASPYRMAIIRDGEYMTAEAQNALLKTLEEPPGEGVIIVTARDPAVFLPTAASRFQRIFFATLPKTQMLDFINKYGRMSPSRAQTVAQQSFGRIGRAVELLGENTLRQKAREFAVKTISGTASASWISSCSEELSRFFDEQPLSELFFSEELIDELRERDRTGALAGVCRMLVARETLSLNTRLYLKRMLWTIHSHSH